VLFIKKNKAYVGHVGDSGILIGCGNDSYHSSWTGKKLTRDHKPEDPVELERIQKSGGQVVSKGGVNRVVWNRPVQNNLGEKRYEKVPFLAVARSLGDLWSYNYDNDEFTVSPIPDCFTFDIDPSIHKCIIIATDGLWNVFKPNEAVECVRQTDMETENLLIKSSTKNEPQPFVNPSQRLVNIAVQRCSDRMLRADNTTCITIMIDNPGKSLTDNILKDDTLDDSQTIEDLCSTRISEYATPISRSRSLVSLRRRHRSGGGCSESKTKSAIKPSIQTSSNTNKMIIKKKLFSQSVQNIRTNSELLIKTDSDTNLILNLNNKENEINVNKNNNNNLTNIKTFKKNNFYRQRLLIIKNRLIKTKNCLFRRKRKSFNVRRSTEKSLSRSVRKKSHLNQSYATNVNESIIYNIKSRFNNSIKRMSSQNDFNDDNQRSCKKTRYI
jgi:serine/threonine protein phosphatase PrpC